MCLQLVTSEEGESMYSQSSGGLRGAGPWSPGLWGSSEAAGTVPAHTGSGMIEDAREVCGARRLVHGTVTGRRRPKVTQGAPGND